MRREAEDLLLEVALRGDVAATARAAAHVLHAVDPEGSRRRKAIDDAERFLEVSPTTTGGVKLRGYLTGQHAAAFAVALDAFGAPVPAVDGARDERTPAQRRADALGEVCTRILDTGNTPSTGGVRPQVHILVPLPALESAATPETGADPTDPTGTEGASPGGVTAFGQVIDPDTARQLACDAALTRLVVRMGRPASPNDVLGPRGALVRMLTAPSRPLDVGRTERVVTTAIRAALVARDRHCAFPGCDRPHTWCDAHHLRHWADGGLTSLDNLVLLCSQHHAAVHHNGWTVTLDQGTRLPTFRPPWTDHPPHDPVPGDGVLGERVPGDRVPGPRDAARSEPRLRAPSAPAAPALFGMP